MSSPTNLLLIRHAEVESRYHRVFGGRIDMELSPRGHEQAASLAAAISHKQFKAVYASPMKRVQQTLAPFLADRKCAPITMAGLREVDFGDWTGLGWEEVKARHGVSAFQWLECLEQAAIPNAESAKEFRNRVEPCLQHILNDNKGADVAIACHGGTIRMIFSILLGLPLSRMASFEFDYASLSMVQHRSHKIEVQLLNFTPWREVI